MVFFLNFNEPYWWLNVRVPITQTSVRPDMYFTIYFTAILKCKTQ